MAMVLRHYTESRRRHEHRGLCCSFGRQAFWTPHCSEDRQMTFETLLFERRDQVTHVTLNRPDKLNALNLQMIEDLRAVAAAIDGDPSVRAVLLTGAGRGFSSGADLMGDDLVQDPQRSVGENIRRPLGDHFNPMGTACD